MEIAFCLILNEFKNVVFWFVPQLKQILIQKTEYCFLTFLKSKFFLTILIYMILIGYIDGNSFLFDCKPNKESFLIVFPAI